jgi:hypothetical protein
LDDDIEIKNELVLVDSPELTVIVNRNLQAEMFKDIEPIGILASYMMDYQYVLLLLVK